MTPEMTPQTASKPSLEEVQAALDVLQRAGYVRELPDEWLRPLATVPDAIFLNEERDGDGAAVTVLRQALRFRVRGTDVQLKKKVEPGTRVFIIAREDGSLVVTPWRPELVATSA